MTENENSLGQAKACVRAWRVQRIEEGEDDSSIEYTQYTLVPTATNVKEQLGVQEQDNKPSNWLQKEALRSNEGDEQSVDYDAAFESAEET